MKLDDLKKLAGDPSFRLEVEGVFLEGMTKGYAAGSKKGTIVELPGSKLVPPYIRGPWKVTDTYLVTPLSPRSGGMTIVSYEDIPVWMMQYFGQYSEEVIACLKAALSTAYAEKVFLNGRGPRSFWYNGYTYRNIPNLIPRSRISKGCFEGTEEIVDENDQCHGWHNYQGGMML
jgi:hypothetical protein